MNCKIFDQWRRNMNEPSLEKLPISSNRLCICNNCEWCKNHNKMILDHFILTISPQRTIRQSDFKKYYMQDPIHMEQTKIFCTNCGFKDMQFLKLSPKGENVYKCPHCKCSTKI